MCASPNSKEKEGKCNLEYGLNDWPQSSALKRIICILSFILGDSFKINNSNTKSLQPSLTVILVFYSCVKEVRNIGSAYINMYDWVKTDISPWIVSRLNFLRLWIDQVMISCSFADPCKWGSRYLHILMFDECSLFNMTLNAMIHV